MQDKLPQRLCLTIGCGDQGGATGGDAANRVARLSSRLRLPGQQHQYKESSDIGLLPEGKRTLYTKARRSGILRSDWLVTGTA